MASIRSNTAQLLLDHVPEHEKDQFIRKVVESLHLESSGSEITFTLALMQLHADVEARRCLLNHLQSRVESGDLETVVSILGRNSDLVRDLSRSALSYVAEATLQLQAADSKWITVPIQRRIAVSDVTTELTPLTPDFDTFSSRLGYCLQILTCLDLPVDPPLPGVFKVSLGLTGARDGAICRRARDLTTRLLIQSQLSADDHNQIWDHVQALSAATEAIHRTIGASLWLCWINSQHHVPRSILRESAYWTSIVDGLRHGDSERRKSYLQVLRGSISQATQDPTVIAMVTANIHMSAAPTLIRNQYFRYCTIFETIVLGRYLNQVQECEADLDFLSSAQSVIKATWLYTLLASALDQKMQDSSRRFIGAWILRSYLRTDEPKSFIDFFSKSLLPWAMQGNLFTSSLRTHGAVFRCQHGETLAQYITNLLNCNVELAPAILNAIIDCLVGRHGNGFAYAMVFLMEGIGCAIDRKNVLQLRDDQIERIRELVSWVGLPEVARDYVLARYWKLCKNQLDSTPIHAADNISRGAKLWDEALRKAKDLTPEHSAHTDGSIAQLSIERSRRELSEQDTSRKCQDLIQDLEYNASKSIKALQFRERLEDIWSDLEYQEYPKGLLINISKMTLNHRLMTTVGTEAVDDVGTIEAVANIVRQLCELAVSKSYLLSPLVGDIRRTMFILDAPEAVFNLENFIVNIADAPPFPTIDAQLEDVTSSLMPSIDPLLAVFDYEYYFGRRESFGFAALLDLVSRLGSRHKDLIERIFDRLLERWVSQKLPPPTVSLWKKTLQLQIMLLCSEQCVSGAEWCHKTERVLNDLHSILAVEPLPRHRYLLEWMIVRIYLHHPRMKSKIFDELNTKDHHSNPKFLASLMKIGVTVAKTEGSNEHFALQLATTFVPLAASSKVVIRHEAQWQVPILLDHARAKGWSSIVGSTAFDALDGYIRSLERFGDPPLERQIDKFDPVKDHSFTNLVDGLWYGLDHIEPRQCRREDFVQLYKGDASQNLTLPPSCMPLGEPLVAPSVKSDPDSAVPDHERSLLQNIDNISRALGSGPVSNALQTKGAAYLESRRARNSNLIVVASLVDNPHNLGGLSRVSEVFGAGALYLHHLNVTSNKDFTNVSVSSHQHIPINPLAAANVVAFLAEKKQKEGFAVVGIEQTDRSVLLGEQECALPEKCILVIGSEREGIPALVLTECDILVEIPQVGITRSLNVQTAAGIVLCEYARQRRALKS